MIHELAFSPNGEHLVALDLSGNLTIWDAKKFVRVEFFSKTTIAAFLRKFKSSGKDEEPSGKKRVKEISKDIHDNVHVPLVRKVEWWDDRSLLILRRNGDALVLGVLEKFAGHPKNLLGEVPEIFDSSTILSSVVDGGFFLLEYKDGRKKVPNMVVRDDLTAKVKNAAK
jgi:hypothetical protein